MKRKSADALGAGRGRGLYLSDIHSKQENLLRTSVLQPMLHHQTIEKSVIYDREDQNDNAAGPSIESQNVFVKKWYYDVNFFGGELERIFLVKETCSA